MFAFLAACLVANLINWLLDLGWERWRARKKRLDPLEARWKELTDRAGRR